MVSEDLRGLDEDYQDKCSEIQKLREDVVRLQTMHQEQRDRLQEKHSEVSGTQRHFLGALRRGTVKFLEHKEMFNIL